MQQRPGLALAVDTHTGRRRTNNEDRFYTNADLGIFAVIDGVGGHAAGERAAETAVEVLRERLERQTGTPEERLREGIALANNEIYRQSRSRAEWNGMACVLTVALIENDVVTVGHVGDSRLYVLRPGEIHKVTHDHSPVGEREDKGELSEADAMAHPRRNEIYRDVGSGERAPDDPSFIEILSFPMPADGAILLCSDGLTDLVGSAEIRADVERNAPDYEAAIAALIEAANRAGGKDNITIALVASPGYRIVDRPEAKVIAPARAPSSQWVWAGAGFLSGALIAAVAAALIARMAASGPRTFVVGAEGIAAAMSKARSGDTVLLPPGKYKEHVQLLDGVTLRGQQASNVILLSPDGGAVVTANKIESGGIEGVWIQGDLETPASKGIEITDASPAVTHVRISGVLTGIEVRGNSSAAISSNQIANNLGTGILVSGKAHPHIENNLIAANGLGKPGPARPGVEVDTDARPVLKDNAVVNNAAEPVWIRGASFRPADYEENFFGGVPVKSAIRLLGEAKP